MSECTCCAIIWIWVQIPYSSKEAKNSHAYPWNDKFNICQIVGKHGCTCIHVLCSRNWLHIFIYGWALCINICVEARGELWLSFFRSLICWATVSHWPGTGHWAPAIHVPASLALGLQGCSITLSSFTGSCNGTQLLVLTTQALYQLNCPCSFNF